MKTLMKRISDTKGFISIEWVLIGGSVILLAALVLYTFNGEADDVAKNSMLQIQKANESMEPSDGTTP